MATSLEQPSSKAELQTSDHIRSGPSEFREERECSKVLPCPAPARKTVNNTSNEPKVGHVLLSQPV